MEPFQEYMYEIHSPMKFMC